jgi:hypothetical protein
VAPSQEEARELVNRSYTKQLQRNQRLQIDGARGSGSAQGELRRRSRRRSVVRLEAAAVLEAELGRCSGPARRTSGPTEGTQRKQERVD